MTNSPQRLPPGPEGGEALLAFFLGPVQPFIAGARTVRDLWTGSYLLAWLTFAALRRLLDTPGARLETPNLSDNPLCWLRAPEGSPPPEITTPCIPNRFIAHLPATCDAHAVAEGCAQACKEEWKTICARVRERLNNALDGNHRPFQDIFEGRQVDLAESWDRLWDAQVESFFEVRTAVLFPAQLPDDLLGTAPESDAAARDVLFGLMDARKSVRHVPPYRAEGMVPQKCTLLGTYEQLGPALASASRAFWERFARHITLEGTRIRSGERLCAISLVKRFAWPTYFAARLQQSIDQLRYSDTATIAAKCWLASAEEAPEEGPRWNGQWLHWSSPEQEGEESPSERVWSWIQRRKRQSSPPTYYAILMADADKLGARLSTLGERVSAALTHFALHVVRSIIENEDSRGELIYSGGDDTLALLPAETAIGCARMVQQKYTENWQRHFPGEPPATLSAGIAVVHHKEDLRFALEAARATEHSAKHFGRDALAISVCRRSGEHSLAVLGWEQTDDLQQLICFFRKGVSDRWTYRLRALLPTFVEMPWESFVAELLRLLRRSEGLPAQEHIDFMEAVRTFAARYLDENRKETRKRPDDKPLQAYAMMDFLTLCQSCSFLARGRDLR